jgi:RHS repeat-associated protein
VQITSNISTSNSPFFNYSEKVQKNAYSRYELSNHLGNVLAVITDRRIQTCGMGDVMHYEAQVVSISDYYPFGMGIKDREWKDSIFSYRFGFGNAEKDDKNSGRGNTLNFGARIYKPQLARWLSIDPFWREYPYASPYSFALNSPIYFIDPDGNVIYGSDGRKVVLNAVKGEDGKYSFVVTSGKLDENSDAYKMLSSMVLTTKGRAALSQMQSSKVKYLAKRMEIITNEPSEEHGSTQALSYLKDNRPRKPYITIYTGYDGMYSDRMRALEGLDEDLYINNVMVHEILGHNENADFATRDLNGWKTTDYGKDLAIRVGKAMKSDKNFETSNIKKEQSDFFIGYLEYDKIKLDLDNSKEILNILHDSGKIDDKDYNVRMEIVNTSMKNLENIKLEVDKKIEDYGKKSP